MHLIMFDIDGTLVDTDSFEDECYFKAVKKVIPHSINPDCSAYANATDSGIIDEIISMNDLGSNRSAICENVKQFFIGYIQESLQENHAIEISGAASFVKYLKSRKDVTLAIATGGWEETAKMKLTTAGIDYSNIAFASGSDSKSRIGIMKMAEERCSINNFVSRTYFGDAIWDKKATSELNYNFILVGNKIKHSKQINDYKSIDNVLSLIGLEGLLQY